MNSSSSASIGQRYAVALLVSLTLAVLNLSSGPAHGSALTGLDRPDPDSRSEAHAAGRAARGRHRHARRRTHAGPHSRSASASSAPLATAGSAPAPSGTSTPAPVTDPPVASPAPASATPPPAAARLAAPAVIRLTARAAAPGDFPVAAPPAAAPPIVPAVPPPAAPANPSPLSLSPQVPSFATANPAPLGVYVDFATAADEASAALGAVAVDPTRPIGSSWFTSPAVTHVFGGVPSVSQQQQFSQAVIDGMNQDYAAAGLSVRFSTNPTGAARELSFLTNAVDPQFPAAIGVGAQSGRDAITFLDRFDFAPDQRSLINALRHNGDHEIGHTLGMEHTAADGFINSAAISSDALAGDYLAFSPDAIQAIRTGLATGGGGAGGLGGQTLVGVPEPASWLVLAVGFGLGLGRWRRR